MNNYLYNLVCFVAFLIAGMPLKAANYGDYNLFAHFNFENEATDAMGNVQATASNLSYEYDSDLGMNVMKFNGADKGNLKLDTYPLSKQMTISLWFNRQDLDETACWQMIFAWYAPDGSNVFLTPKTNWGDGAYLIADNKVYLNYRSVLFPSFSSNSWVHLAVVFDDSEIFAYENGKLVGTGRMVGDITSFGTTEHYFGNYPNNDFKMSGKIGDIRIYHSRLANNQIQAIANKENVPTPDWEYDANKPYAQISFDGNVSDINNRLSIESNVECTTSDDYRKVGLFNHGSYVLSKEDPIGNGMYSVAFVLRPEEVSELEKDGILLDFSGTNGDYVKLYSRYVDGKLLLEAERSENGEKKKSGLTSFGLNPNLWNSIVFCQTYNAAGNGACRIYINGKLAKTGLSFITNNLQINSWMIGDYNGNSLKGEYADIRFYRKELTPEDVLMYHKGNAEAIQLVVYPKEEKQTIRNFGASDGWNGQTVGLYFSEKQREEIAELLFSQEYDENGNPKGIGLSSWRFNIGAGTSEQGDASRISEESRRTECFMNDDMKTYNWTKQAGQRALLELAVKKYEVPDIIGWQNSPPVKFTKRGLGFREYEDEKSSILKPEHYADFGEFLANVIEHFEHEGIQIDYISPLNEPQYDWTCDAVTRLAAQEGSPWSNQEIYDVVVAINDVFQKRNIKSKLFLTEAGAITNHLQAYGGFASQQLDTFWSNGAMSFIDIPSVEKIVSAHSYWTDNSAESIVDNRTALNVEMQLKKQNLEYWQTEYSLLDVGYRFGHPTGKLSPIMSGISLARIIHADLTFANATGWQWWTTFELEKFLDDEERFALIRIALKEDKSGGVYRDTKLLYTLGNYSFFIRPGMKRIELGRSDNMDDYTSITNQMFSAYKDDETGRIVIVAINASTYDSGISLPEIPICDGKVVKRFVPYITSGKDGDDIKCYGMVNANEHYVMPGSSIITFVGEPEDGSSVETVIDNDNVLVYPNPAVDYVKVQSPAVIRQCSIFDLSGKLVQSLDVNNLEFNVNISGLDKGIYLMRLDGEYGTVVKRIIVSK